MDTGEICRQAIRECPDLPEDVRSRAGEIRSVEWSEFDQSYIDFLDEQIGLGARGPEWSDRLKQRKKDYLELIDTKHLNCTLEEEGLIWDFAITTDPPKVVHYEFYSYGTNQNG